MEHEAAFADSNAFDSWNAKYAMQIRICTALIVHKKNLCQHYYQVVRLHDKLPLPYAYPTSERGHGSSPSEFNPSTS